MWFEVISWMKINLAKQVNTGGKYSLCGGFVVTLGCRKGKHSTLLYIWVGESLEEPM